MKMLTNRRNENAITGSNNQVCCIKLSCNAAVLQLGQNARYKLANKFILRTLQAFSLTKNENFRNYSIRVFMII